MNFNFKICIFSLYCAYKYVFERERLSIIDNLISILFNFTSTQKFFILFACIFLSTSRSKEVNILIFDNNNCYLMGDLN